MAIPIFDAPVRQKSLTSIYAFIKVFHLYEYTLTIRINDNSP